MSREWGGYDESVRQQAAQDALELVGSGLSATRACHIVAGELGCHPNSVRAWARELDPDFGRALSSDQVPTEVRQLRSEVQRLREMVRKHH